MPEDNVKEKLSPTRENYLRAVHYLSQSEEGARLTDIAILLGVSKPSVNCAMKGLSRSGLVQKELYGQVFLTPAGRDQALALKKRYDVTFSLLVNILGVDKSIAAQDAGSMEHIISDESIKAINEFLENIKKKILLYRTFTAL